MRRSAALLALLCAQPLPATCGEDREVARVGARVITESELATQAEARLLESRTLAYEVQRRALQELIEARLLEAEASRRGTSVAELLQQEVEAKAAPISEWDVRVAYTREAQRYADLAEPDGLRLAETRLRAERVAQRRFGFLAQLRGAAGVTTSLLPPRVAIDPGHGAVRGPARAAVTIVEFSDFECPFCARAAATLQQLLARYPEQVRLVFRHFPADKHRRARPAAEAAECAGAQGRFWELHDRLFADQKRLADADLRAHARAIGLDGPRFDACLESGQMAARWREDEAAAERFGLFGTPLFLINGRLLLGAQPYAVFARMIEEELAATGTPTPPR